MTTTSQDIKRQASVPYGSSMNHTMDEVDAIATRMPFDILSQIFTEYLSEETPAFPVETLLLVCQSWSHAARGHSSLWSTFRMQTEDFAFWRSCIPRRLALCSIGALIDIDVHLNLCGYNRMDAISNLYNDILSILTGPNGEVAQRWRRFSALDPYSQYKYKDINRSRFFIFPTPHLQQFQVYGFHSSSPILPNTPSLKSFSAVHVNMICLPDLSTTVDVVLDPKNSPEMALKGATLLRSLKLKDSDFIASEDYSTYRLSSSHPHLKVLHLTSSLLEDGLKDFSAPILEQLSVNFFTRAEFLSVLSCQGLSVERLREIKISLGGEKPFEPTSVYLEGLHQFLSAAKSVTVLELDDSFATSLILKLLEAEHSLLGHGHPYLRVGDHVIELEQGHNRSATVQKVRNLLPDVCDGSWEEIFAHIDSHWRFRFVD